MAGPSPDSAATTRELAQRLRRDRAALLARWKVRVRELPGARDLPEPLLQNEVGELLDELVGHLEQAHEDGVEEARVRREIRAAAVHGVERLRAGFDIEEVVAEYDVLRELVFGAAADLALAHSLVQLVNGVVDRCIGSAVESYDRQRSLEELRRRSDHIAFVTHEMRGPLSTISTVTALLEDARSTPEPDLTVMLRQNVRRLDGLIRQLIEESRQIGGDLLRDRRPAAVPLAPVAQAICGEQKAPAAAAGIELRIEVSDELLVWADPNLLDIVLSNLVKNAIDHSGARIVRVGASAEDGQVLCWVEDDGRGIPPERLRVIFEPYETRDQPGAGRGLGLHIARRFAEALEGTLLATLPPGGSGARFELRLPRSHGRRGAGDADGGDEAA